MLSLMTMMKVFSLQEKSQKEEKVLMWDCYEKIEQNVENTYVKISVMFMLKMVYSKVSLVFDYILHSIH